MLKNFWGLQHPVRAMHGRRTCGRFAVGLFVVAIVPLAGASFEWSTSAAASPPLPAASRPLAAGDWPMWGGSMNRNMVADAVGLPTEWDERSGENVKWVADLGSNTYGNPVVAGGKVFVGTNNDLLRDPEVVGDKGIVMAFSEADGSFLWQMAHDKLAAGQVNDWPFQGICSSPLVEGDRLY